MDVHSILESDAKSSIMYGGGMEHKYKENDQ